jgi:uncharacterized repeat protein (TIGR01451 family)
MLRKLFIAGLFLLFVASLAHAQPAELWETGQTTCYDTAGSVIACPATGQDGDWQAGVTWPSPRFTDNGDGTVTDNLTGLIWLKNANCFGVQTWANALNAANTLNSGECGLSDGSAEGDWRLPNRKELRSLINYGQADSATWLNGQGFINVQSVVYWSSSTYAFNTGLAWIVYMWDGYVVADYKTPYYYVWPVRAGTLGDSDLSVTKTDSPDPVTVGNNLTYTVTITNNGPDAATGVTLTDTLPGGVTVVSIYSTNGACSLASGTVTCNFDPMANGAVVTVTIVVTPNTPGGITNTATVAGNETDPNTANNTATAVTTVIQPSDLSVTKTDAPDPVTVGSNLTYTVTITNNGPDAATGVTLTDTLPGGVTFVSATPSQGSCNQAAGVVTCNLGSLANGASATVTIVVTPNTPGGISNTATVAGNETDPNTANNTATAQTTVQAAAVPCLYTMPIPTGPTNVGTFPPGLLMSWDPWAARPFGLEEAGGMLTGWLWLPCWWNGNVDIYLVLHQSPYGQLIMNNFHQWLPYPANIVPWKANTADPLYVQLFSYLKSTVAAGLYHLDVVVVPSGTPASAIPGIVEGTATTPYYKWRFTKTLP